MQLQVKTILNAIQHFPGFVYQDIRLSDPVAGQSRELHITVLEHVGGRPNARAANDRAPAMIGCPRGPWLFIPLWGLVTRFIYAARRVQCPAHGW